jgi:hypothetical protein
MLSFNPSVAAVFVLEASVSARLHLFQEVSTLGQQAPLQTSSQLDARRVL